MTKDTFHVDDVVEMLPYDQVQNHYWLPEETWNECMQNNPSIEEAMKKFLAEHTFRFWINELGEPCFEWEPCSQQVAPNVEDLL